MAMRLGTLGYMSPEQVRRQPVDARADVFAAGAILYEMAALRPAFDGSSEYEIMERIVSGEFEELPPVPGDTSGVLAKALLLALAPDPHDRLPSAAALADALRAPAAAELDLFPETTNHEPELALVDTPLESTPAKASAAPLFLWLLLVIGGIGAWVTYSKVTEQLAAQAVAKVGVPRLISASAVGVPGGGDVAGLVLGEGGVGEHGVGVVGDQGAAVAVPDLVVGEV